jgi:hypothetical protein
MNFSLRVLGVEIFGWSLGASFNGDERTEWNGSTHTNGLFERDTEPLRADRMEPYYEEQQIGFR